MVAERELSLTDYLSIFKLRWKPALTAFLLILATCFALALLLPAKYESTGLILVESPQISSVVVEDTAIKVSASERIELIKQRVMTRDNLFRIIKKFNLYPNDVESKATSKLIDDMRESVLVELVENKNQENDDNVAISFLVGFEYEKPELAHKVANELVTLFLDANVKTRNARAVETTDFLTQETGRLKTELESVENKVAIYKKAHADNLPEHVSLYMGMIERTDADIKEVDRDTKSTQEELRYLDVELTSAQSATKNSAISTTSELDKARSELDRVLIIYKETHPTIRNLKRKIENLEKAASQPSEAAPIKNDIATELVISKIQSQIEAAKTRLNSLADQKRALQSKIGQLQAQVTKSPEVERGLFTLMRDYENAKTKYEEVKSKQVNAKIAENLESENKVERFSLIEPPVYPDKASKPDRKKIMAIGVIGSIGGAFALALLLDMLDKRVRGVESLTTIIKTRPMVIIPYISTRNEIEHGKYLFRYILSAITILLILFLLFLHFFIMPIDLLIAKLIAMFA